MSKNLVQVSRALSKRVSALKFGPPVAYVYNPLEYARAPHEAYLKQYGHAPKRVLLLGMNPGPFGMAQTGVPFGDVRMVRDFLGVAGRVGKPELEHPKRLITGFECARSEVSGSRLWGLAHAHFKNAEQFFEDFFVANYCPLVFMDEGARNLTPDKLPRAEQAPLFAACDDALRATVAELSPRFVIGVGAFAKARAVHALPDFKGTIGTILHPSPASPKANRSWSQIALGELRALGAL
ncbi:MAG TPA: uracil-DNA glycosylase family protein [Polyangiaceae bacterium]|jgi:single-strand selective monofunctional uracil DNA glycosylase|nr:uracil-DNA glycosylase family protein [Polyangiaceae bacterium]